MSHKINLTFDIFSLQQPLVSSIIKKCIQATLDAEGVTADCEINVLVTNDKGIHAINLASRQIDRPTDVLSFPMFQLEPGNPPKTGRNTWTLRRTFVPWAICASPWSVPRPRPRSSAIPPGGRLATSPSTPCSTCSAMTTWTKAP